MKIQLMSDLHLEFGWDIQDLSIEEKQDTTLILAGDIESNLYALENTYKYFATKYKYVIAVLGNHEFYNNEMEEVYAVAKKVAAETPNFFFLEQDFVNLDGIVFGGGVLWSDPDVYAWQRVNDARLIRTKGKLLGIGEVRDINQKTRKYLEDLVNFYKDRNEKLVIVTHFGPDDRLMNPRWTKSVLLNTYFWNTGMEQLFHHVDHWMFGHTHDPVTAEISGCKFHCNPHGYYNPKRGREHNLFNPDYIIEV